MSRTKEPMPYYCYTVGLQLDKPSSYYFVYYSLKRKASLGLRYNSTIEAQAQADEWNAEKGYIQPENTKYNGNA